MLVYYVGHGGFDEGGESEFFLAIRRTREDLFGINDVIRNVFLDAGDMEMLDEFGFSAGELGGLSSVAREKHMNVMIEFLVFPDAEKNARRRELFKALVKACGAKGFMKAAMGRSPVVQTLGQSCAQGRAFSNA